MDKFQKFKNLLRFLDAAIFLTLFAIISIFGLFCIYLFLVEPAMHHLPIDYVDVVFGSGIFAIGLSAIFVAIRKTQAAAWLALANIPAWFLLYGVTFDASRDIQPNFRSAVSFAIHFILLVSFVIMARRSYLREQKK